MSNPQMMQAPGVLAGVCACHRELHAWAHEFHLVCQQGDTARDWQPVGSMLQQAWVVLGDIGEADVFGLHISARQLRHPPAQVRGDMGALVTCQGIVLCC